MSNDFGFAGSYEGIIDFCRLQDGVQQMTDDELANLLDYVLFNLTERNQRDEKLEALTNGFGLHRRSGQRRSSMRIGPGLSKCCRTASKQSPRVS